MPLVELFLSFLKIGFTSFGGLSMIPLINAEMLAHGWMTAEEVADIVAIAEMTPGPLGLNCATFAGMQAAGIPGAIAANLGVLTTTLTLGALTAIFFFRFKHSIFLQRILIGIRPACFGMVLGVLISLVLSSYTSGTGLNYASCFLGLIDLVLIAKYKVSIPKVILFSAGMGLVLFGLPGVVF